MKVYALMRWYDCFGAHLTVEGVYSSKENALAAKPLGAVLALTEAAVEKAFDTGTPAYAIREFTVE